MPRFILRPMTARAQSVVVITVIAFAAAAAAFAATPARAAPEPAFQAAFQQFAGASSGDTAAIDKSADAFEALLKAEPANPVLMAYAGAATAMRAGTTMLPMRKMAFAEDGLALLDKSLAMLAPEHDAPIQRGTPGSLETRFVAANTFLAVPSFMNRGARGTKLLNDVLGSPLFATAPLPFKASVWMRAAALATKEQRPEDARRYLNEVISQNAPQAEAAKAKLKELAA